MEKVDRADKQTVLWRIYNDAIVPLFDTANGKIEHYLFKTIVLQNGKILAVLNDGREFIITCEENV